MNTMNGGVEMGIVQVERDAVYEPADVAEMFGLAEKSVKRLVYEGRLKARKLGRQMVFLGADILDLPEWEPRAKPKAKRTRKSG
jgi:hypothetical protein